MRSRPVDEPERARLGLARRLRRLAAAERRGEAVIDGGAVAAALAIALLAGDASSLRVGTAAMYVVALAIAANVRFDTGVGYAYASQLIFVPMLFVLPPALVPLLVVIALPLADLPEVLQRRRHPSRMWLRVGNAWFAIGPALVLLLTGVPRPGSPVVIAVLAAVLAAELAFDLASNGIRECVWGDLRPRQMIVEVRVAYAIDAAVTPVGLAIAVGAVNHPWVVLLVLPLFGLLHFFSHERTTRLEQLIELSDAYRGTAELLGDLVEADDGYTGQHCREVVALARQVALAMGLEGHQLRNVEFAALLHDVGKIAIPKQIVNKPGQLHAAEWAIVRTHTLVGEQMLSKVGGFMAQVGGIVRSTHERWDGRGYPDGLVGVTIPLESRIVAVCDAFNAMTTTRSYRAAMRPGDAVAELIRNAGTQFDAAVVDAVLSTIARHKGTVVDVIPVSSPPSSPLSSGSRADHAAHAGAPAEPAAPGEPAALVP